SFEEHFPTLGIHAEAGPVRQGLVGPNQGAFQDEFADRPPRRLGGDLKFLFRLRCEPEVQLGGTRRSSWHGSSPFFSWKHIMPARHRHDKRSVESEPWPSGPKRRSP